MKILIHLQHVWVVVANWNGRNICEAIKHCVVVSINDVVSYGLVIVHEECDRRH